MNLEAYNLGSLRKLVHGGEVLTQAEVLAEMGMRGLPWGQAPKPNSHQSSLGENLLET